jgi:MATE family multidrug resistance protein
MKNDFSLSKIIQLTFPTLISQATLMLVGIIDMYFAGTIGTAAITALAIAHTSWSMIVAFFEGLRLGTTILASQFFGAQREEDMYHVGRIGLGISFIMGALLIIFGKPISILIYSIIIKDPEVQKLGIQYLPIILASGGFVFSTFVIDGMFRSVNRVTIPTIITVITQSLNIMLNCVFVWGKIDFVFRIPWMTTSPFNIPVKLYFCESMGIKGIAYATLTAYMVATLFAVGALYFQGFKQLFKKLSSSFRTILGEYFRSAAGVGLHSGFRLMAMLIFNKMLGVLGTSAVASFQIASQVFHMSYIPGLAFMFTMSLLIARLMGAKQTHMLWHVAVRVAGTALACSALLGIIVYGSALHIAQFFSPTDLAVAQDAAMLIRIVAFNQFIVMLNFMFRGYLNGAKETTFLMLASVLTTYGVFLPIAYLCAVPMGYGLIGAYVGVVTWNIVDTLVNAFKARQVAHRLRQEDAIIDAIENPFDE